MMQGRDARVAAQWLTEKIAARAAKIVHRADVVLVRAAVSLLDIQWHAAKGPLHCNTHK